MKYAFKIIILLTLFMSSTAYSQNEQKLHPLDSLYDACIANFVGDPDKINCTREAIDNWDDELNKYYKLLMNVLDSNTQNVLRKTQRQWIKYRDTEFDCVDSLYNIDGTMYPILAIQRKMKIVRTRALELKRYYWIKTEEE